METKNYQQLAHTLRLSEREIGRRANVSHTTVRRALEDPTGSWCSADTKKRIQQIIEEEAKTVQKNLERLANFD